jgi:hypothetical protein
MIFLEILGAAVLLTLFGIGAWHFFKHVTKKGDSE